jgi:hypothetical protein
MRFQIEKTANQTLVRVETKLTKEILTRVPETIRQLKEDNKVVFVVSYSKDPSIKTYGMSIPGKTFYVDVTDQKVEDVQYLLAGILPTAEKVENKIVEAYKAMKDAAEKIEVKGE